VTYLAGDRVEYTGPGVFDLIIRTGDVGTVTSVKDGWVFAIWPRSGEHSVPLLKVRQLPALLPAPWWQPDETGLAALLRELKSELSPGHPLYRLPVDVRSRCGACDEVLISVVGGTFSLVHLSWSGRPEHPPYPLVTMIGPYKDATLAQERHGATH
jgi:hypothetical protein